MTIDIGTVTMGELKAARRRSRGLGRAALDAIIQLRELLAKANDDVDGLDVGVAEVADIIGSKP
jgi:hypothetical protein